jgi:hypothetical protein
MYAHGQKKKPRIVFAPPSYYKAEAFIELNESDRQMYVAGLMDGFYASAFFGASDETVANLTSCTKDMDTKQVSAIITKYVSSRFRISQKPQRLQQRQRGFAARPKKACER